MRYIVSFGRFWYDFIVGDDWTIALAVVIVLAIVAISARDHSAAWWLLPIAVVVTLGESLWRESRRVQQDAGGDKSADGTVDEAIG